MSNTTLDIIANTLDNLEFVIRYCELLDDSNDYKSGDLFTIQKSLLVTTSLRRLYEARDLLELLRRMVEHERVKW